MERTKLLFGYDQRLESSNNHANNQQNSSSTSRGSSKLKQVNHHHQSHHQQQQQAAVPNSNGTGSSQPNGGGSVDAAIKQLLELLKSSPNLTLNRAELLKSLGQPGSKTSDLSSIISAIAAAAASTTSPQQLDESGGSVNNNNNNNNLVPNASSTSLTSLASSGVAVAPGAVVATSPATPTIASQLSKSVESSGGGGAETPTNQSAGLFMLQLIWSFYILIDFKNDEVFVLLL